MAEMKSDGYRAYISEFISFRGYHIVIAYDGYTINGGELGKSYTTAIQRLTDWADKNGYTNLGGGAWYKDRGGK